MSDPKTRFVVKVNGRLRELMAVRLGKSGDLTIISKAGRNVPDGKGGLIERVNNRYSIHVSPTSAGYTFTRTEEFADGRQQRKTSRMVFPLQGKTLAHVFGRVCGELEHERFHHSPRRRDHVVPLFGADIEHLTLFFMVVVSDYAVAKGTLAKTKLCVAQADIGRWRLSVLSGLFPMRATEWHFEFTVPSNRNAELATGLPASFLFASKTETEMVNRLKRNIRELRDMLVAAARQGTFVDGESGKAFTEQRLEAMHASLSSVLTPRDE